METRNLVSDGMANALEVANAALGKSQKKSDQTVAKGGGWSAIVERLVAFVKKAFVLPRMAQVLHNRLKNLRAKKAEITGVQKELLAINKAQEGPGGNPMAFVNTLRSEAAFVSNKDKEAEIKQTEDELASLGENPRTTRGEILATEEKLKNLRDENHRMARDLQHELARALIMNACPGVEADPWPRDVPMEIHGYLLTKLTEEEQRKLQPMLAALYLEGKMLNNIALILEGCPGFKVDPGQSLAKTVAKYFLNDFLPEALKELQAHIEGPEFPNLPEGEKQVLLLGKQRLEAIMGVVPPHLPEWARRIHDAERNKRLEVKEKAMSAPQAATPTKETQPKALKPARESVTVKEQPEPEIVRAIQIFINRNGLTVGPEVTKKLIQAIAEIKKGAQVATPLGYLCEAQKGLSDEIANGLDALMEGVREHFRQQKDEASKPQRPPFQKEDVVLRDTDRDVVRWLKQEVLLARWDDFSDETRRLILIFCGAVQKLLPIHLTREQLTRIAESLGGGFTELVQEMKNRLNTDRKAGYEEWLAEKAGKSVAEPKAEVPATKLEQKPQEPTQAATPEPEPEPKKPAPTEAVAHKKSPRFKWEDFADKKGDEEIVETLKVFTRSNRNALGKPAGGHLKKALEALGGTGSVVDVLKHVRDAVKAAGRHTLGDAFNKLEKAIAQHYEEAELERATAPTTPVMDAPPDVPADGEPPATPTQADAEAPKQMEATA